MERLRLCPQASVPWSEIARSQSIARCASTHEASRSASVRSKTPCNCGLLDRARDSRAICEPDDAFCLMVAPTHAVCLAQRCREKKTSR
jgi:hypothetical protein